jgi:4-hydroxybenzoate polyprenyltransferase
MKSLWHFFRLIRPLNLAVIALTMGVFQIFLSKYQPAGLKNYTDYSVQNADSFVENSFWDSSVFEFDFLLLVLSTILIAAAGNIINDYFDVKADRINKPELLIIDKYLKRRWAIIWHWSFNSIGIIIAFYLSWKLSNWWIGIFSFVCINLLWFYSAIFKRKFLLGNLVVAFLVAIVPLYVLIFSMPLENITATNGSEFYVFSPSHLILLTLSLAATSFFVNLIREIIKDIADVKGDLLLNAVTLPIKLGIKKTKWILFVLLLPLLVSLLMYVFFAWEMEFYLNGYTMGNDLKVDWSNQAPIYFLISGASLAVITSYGFLLMSNQRKYYLVSSNLLKLAMFFGLLTPLFL